MSYYVALHWTQWFDYVSLVLGWRCNALLRQSHHCFGHLRSTYTCTERETVSADVPVWQIRHMSPITWGSGRPSGLRLKKSTLEWEADKDTEGTCLRAACSKWLPTVCKDTLSSFVMESHRHTPTDSLRLLTHTDTHTQLHFNCSAVSLYDCPFSVYFLFMNANLSTWVGGKGKTSTHSFFIYCLQNASVNLSSKTP